MNILCKLGLHKISKTKYITVHKQRGKHKYRRNYMVCDRCGKLVTPFKWVRKKNEAKE